MKNVIVPLAEVLKQTKVGFTSCSDRNGQSRKQPNCYIHLKEVGGNNEFWAKMTGDNALLVLKPGERVEVDLSFQVQKNSRKFSQKAVVNSISHVRSWDKMEKMPWDY